MSVWRKWSPAPALINQAPLFGEAFSRALRDGCVETTIQPRWALEIWALESGLDPLRENSYGYRGLWQRGPNQVKSGDTVVLVPYAVTDPTQQIRDYFAFTKAQMKSFRVTSFQSREHAYCANVAPARLFGGAVPGDTPVYTATRDGAKYYANAPQLDPAWDPTTKKGKGYFTIAEMAAGIDRFAKPYEMRIDRELSALLAVDRSPPPDDVA